MMVLYAFPGLEAKLIRVRCSNLISFFSLSIQPVCFCTALLSMFQAELSQSVQMCDS